MTPKKAARQIQRCLLYMTPARYASQSGSVYLFFPHGVLRVSDHDTRKPIRWKLLTNAKHADGYHCYGTCEMGHLVHDIKEDMRKSEFAGRVI